MLTQEEINQFKELYKKEFGEEIDDQTALLLANNLLNLMQSIYKPIPRQAKLPIKGKLYANEN